MKIFISTCLFLILGQLVYGQLDLTQQNSQSFSKELGNETKPKFPGGQRAIDKILADSMVYPNNALKDRIGGRVLTQFAIDTLGNVVGIKVVKGIREDIDNEAIRLIGLLNGWIPGTKNGQKVKGYFRLLIDFFPDNKFKREYLKEHNINN